MKKKQTKAQLKPAAPIINKGNATGIFQKKDGAVIILPPDDSQADSTVATSPDTVVKTSRGAVTIQVEGDNAASQVWDKDSELLAHDETLLARKENTARAAEAAQVLQPKRLKSGTVVTAGTIDDIDLSSESVAPAFQEQDEDLPEFESAEND